MKFLNSNYGNDGITYADFGVARTRTKGTNRTQNPNPFTGNKPIGTKKYGDALTDNIKSARNIMGSVPADQKTMKTPKKGTKTGVALKKAGRFAMKNKVGLGLAAAGALGAVGYGAYRKLKPKK